MTLTPELPLLPGNLATFVTRRGQGVVTATITTNRDTWTGTAANGPDTAVVSKFVETGHEYMTVSFMEDGSEYASGTFTIER